MDERMCFKLGIAKVLLKHNPGAKFHLFIFKKNIF